MDINVDWVQYAEKVLKRLEKELKNCKYGWKKEYLKRDIEKHKNRYAEYLK